MKITLDQALVAKVYNNLPTAQYKLDTAIVNDMVPYMPMQTGTFINTVRMRNAAMAGTGVVCAATGVMGRYLYYGVKMVDSKTLKGPRVIPIGGGEVIFRYRKGAKLIPTSIPLNYNKTANAMAGPRWYDAAKRDHYTEWAELVKEAIINGK